MAWSLLYSQGNRAGMVKNLIIYVAIGYITGLFLGNLSLIFPIFSFLAGVGGLCLLRLLGRRHGTPDLLVWLCFGFVVFGVFRVLQGISPWEKNPLNFLIGKGTVQVDGIVSSPVQKGPKKSVVVLNVDSIKKGEIIHQVKGRVKLSMWGVGDGVEYGDRVRVRTRLRPPLGLRNPGVFDYGDYLKRQGVHALASVRKPEFIEWEKAEKSAPIMPVYRLRENIRKLLVNSLSPRSSSIYQAMVIGETRPITYEIRKPFMISGTVHLLSISGSHLAMVAWMVFQGSRGFFRLLRPGWILALSRRINLVRFPVICTVFPVVGYTLLSGSQVETVRAMVMVLVYLAAFWVQRSNDSLNALAFSALLILICDPQAVFSVSFQLSYITVLTLILFHRQTAENPEEEKSPENSEPGKIPFGWNSIGKKLREGLVFSFVAGVATFPLTAFYFNQISWVGFGANLLAIPFVGFILVPLGLISSLGASVFGSEQVWFPGLLEILGEALFSFVQLSSRIPGAEVYVPSPPVIVVLAIYGFAAILFSPAGRSFSGKVAVYCLVIFAGLWVFRLFFAVADHELQIIFFDVGQGDGAWVRFPDGKTMIIDGGRAHGNFDVGRFVIAPFLNNAGQRKIDFMVATHPQLDHVGGLKTLIERFSVGEVWTNGEEKDTPFYGTFRSGVQEKGIAEKPVFGNLRPILSGEKYEVKVLGPFRVDGKTEKKARRLAGARENDHSVVLRIQYKNEVILFTGDVEESGERDLLKWGDLLRSTVLKVPHHGSRSSILPEFIRGVRPRFSVISAGLNNPYRHPSVETLEAYRKIRSMVLRTDQQGAIVYKTDGDTRIFKTASDFKLKRVGLGNPWISTELNNLKLILDHFWYGPTGGPV